MADSLYVAHFSNGHIKVGRSIDPRARIAQHEERVACLGVLLAEHFVSECTGPAAPREQMLIARCAESAAARYQNEWFSGLDYADACAWAVECAQYIIPDPTINTDSFGARLTLARKAKGLTQTDLGMGLRMDGGNLNKAAVWHWESDHGYPNVIQLKGICERLQISADALLALPLREPA